MKSAELKIKLCVCVLAQRHVWEGAQHAVLPSVRLGSRGTSVFGLPTLSGDWQGGTDDISYQEEEEGSVTGWTREVAFACTESTAHSSKHRTHREPATVFVVRSWWPRSQCCRVPGRMLRNICTPRTQALILCNRLCQTIKELSADPYGN